MTFDELWEQVCSAVDLPEGTRIHLSASLLEKTKAIIAKRKRNAEERTIVRYAIGKIINGSIEAIDDLVMESLEKRRI